jgi:hypothetical protein
LTFSGLCRHFAQGVTDAYARATADAIVANGMRDAGYIYVNIDDFWRVTRDADDVLHSNNKFPDMKALADYLHSKELKAVSATRPSTQKPLPSGASSFLSTTFAVMVTCCVRKAMSSRRNNGRRKQVERLRLSFWLISPQAPRDGYGSFGRSLHSQESIASKTGRVQNAVLNFFREAIVRRLLANAVRVERSAGAVFLIRRAASLIPRRSYTEGAALRIIAGNTAFTKGRTLNLSAFAASMLKRNSSLILNPIANCCS